MTDSIRRAMWKAMARSPFLMIRLDDYKGHSEPMTAQLDEAADGEFWFFTTRSNRIAAGGKAMAQFVSRDHDLFCCLSGTLKEEDDRAVIDNHWSASIEAWYEGGRTDPELLMLRFELDEAEIWQRDTTLKGLFKLMTDKAVRPGELGDHEIVSLSSID